MYVVSGLSETFYLSSGVDPPLMMEMGIMTETMDTSFIASAEFETLVSCKYCFNSYVPPSLFSLPLILHVLNFSTSYTLLRGAGKKQSV
jgi:hypothetical protein